MTPQAKNSIDLYRGQNPAQIKVLLGMQKDSVVNELKSRFNADTLGELAVKLSIGQL